jgi:tetratricopeptide (TPR) repeat protein
MIADDSAAVEYVLLRGDWRKALAELRKVKAGTMDPLEYVKLHCCTYLQAGNWIEVTNIAATAAQHYPQEGIFYECWAWAEHISGNCATALRVLESAVSRFGDRESFVYLLACLYASADKFAEAERYLARAKELSPNVKSFLLKATRQRELQVLWARNQIHLSA